jgi:hypothetical protein
MEWELLGLQFKRSTNTFNITQCLSFLACHNEYQLIPGNKYKSSAGSLLSQISIILC